MFWDAIKNSTNPEEYEAYLEEFPDGKFSALAKIRARSLRSNPPAAPAGNDQTTTGSSTPPRPEPVVVTPAPAPEPEPAPKPEPEPVIIPVAEPEPVVETSGSLVTQSSGLFFKDCETCPEMIDIQPGSYEMGSDNKQDSASPRHQVNLDYGFAIARHEITKQQWNFCVDQGGCRENSRNRTEDDFQQRTPAVNISWDDTQDYTNWISEFTGQTYRLPSEAEWEYVARGGSQTTYWWGNTMQDGFANCRDCGGIWDKKVPATVDSLPSNPFGVYGIVGGVSEWTQDCWFNSYSKAPKDGSARLKTDCTSRVLRGGSWKNDSSYLRSASRMNYDYNVRYNANGFRIVRD